MDPTAQNSSSTSPNSVPPTPLPVSTLPPTAPTPISSQPPPQPSKKLNFLKFGLLEIVFVLFLLAIILGILSFFHIIRPFSFFSQSSDTTPSLSPQPTVTLAQPTPLSLNALTLAPLSTYVTNVLKPDFLPSENLNGLIAQEVNNTLQAQWTQNNTSLNLNALYQPTQSATSPATLSLNINATSIAKNLTSPLTSSSAQMVMDTYFLPLSIKASWKCTATSTNSECYLSEKSASGITGVSVLLNPAVNTTPANVLVTHCSIPVTSTLYASSTSCLPILPSK